MPTVPEIAYTNTVLKKTYAEVQNNQPWVMFLNPDNPKGDVRVFKQFPGSTVIEEIPVADYGITIISAAPWEFTLQYTTPQPWPQYIVIFRRVPSVFEDFQPGAFLNADTLNSAFNIETLSINDLTYYQEYSRPGYDPQQVGQYGSWDQPVGPQTDESNVKLAESNYRLPYLAHEPTVTAGDVYVWGYKVIAGPAGGAPRVGEFEDVLLAGAGDPTAGQLKQDLARQCIPANDEGSKLIGTCSTAIDNAGWTSNAGKTLTQYLGNLFHSDAATLAQNGANLVGLGINTGVHPGTYSVQTYLSNLPALGTVGNYAGTSGASYIGYGGWSVSNDTVAGCLSRLNGAATSSTESGAEYVTWWGPGGGSFKVQQGLERVADQQVRTATLLGAAVPPEVGFAPFTGAFALISHIRMIVLEVGGQDGNSRVMCGPFGAGTATFGIQVFFPGSNNVRALLITKSAGTNPTWTVERIGAWPSPPNLDLKLTAYLRPDYV